MPRDQRRDPDPIAVGRLIRQFREVRGITSKTAASKRCNMTDTYWGQLERGWIRETKDGRTPANLDDGAALRIVWGLGLTTAEQAELFDVAALDHLKPRPVPAATLFDPAELRQYTDTELRWFEDEAAKIRLQRQGRLRKGGDDAHGRIAGSPAGRVDRDDQ